jgi:hypothetical protein
MTWWEKQGNIALATCIKGVIHVRHSAETGQENSGNSQEETSRNFEKKSGHNAEMRHQFHNKNRRRTKS